MHLVERLDRNKRGLASHLHQRDGVHGWVLLSHVALDRPRIVFGPFETAVHASEGPAANLRSRCPPFRTGNEVPLYASFSTRGSEIPFPPLCKGGHSLPPPPLHTFLGGADALPSGSCNCSLVGATAPGPPHVPFVRRLRCRTCATLLPFHCKHKRRSDRNESKGRNEEKYRKNERHDEGRRSTSDHASVETSQQSSQTSLPWYTNANE